MSGKLMEIVTPVTEMKTKEVFVDINDIDLKKNKNGNIISAILLCVCGLTLLALLGLLLYTLRVFDSTRGNCQFTYLNFLPFSGPSRLEFFLASSATLNKNL